MEEKVTVTLTSPAKIDGKLRPAGWSGAVTTELEVELRAAKVIHCDLDDIAEDVRSSDDLRSAVALELGRRAVSTAVAQRDAHWSTALDHFETMWEDQKLAALQHVEGEHRAEIETLDIELDTAKARIAALETELAVAKATPEAETISGSGSKTKPKT